MIFVLNRRVRTVIEKIMTIITTVQAITSIAGLLLFMMALVSEKQGMYADMTNAALAMTVSFSVIIVPWTIMLISEMYTVPDFIITNKNQYYTISIENKTDLSRIVQQDDFRQAILSLIDKMDKDGQTRLEKKIQLGNNKEIVRLRQYKEWKSCIENRNNNKKLVCIDKMDKDGQWLHRERYREKQLVKPSIDSMSLGKLKIGTWEDLVSIANKSIVG